MMRNPLDRLDDALHGLADARLKRWQRLALFSAACLFFCLALQAIGFTHAADVSQKWMICVLFMTLFALMMVPVFRRITQAKGSFVSYCLMIGVCASLLLLRIAMLEHQSADYQAFLHAWVSQIRPLSFQQAMLETDSNYTVIYRYIVFLISRMPVSDLYIYKAVSIAFDILLAYAVMRLYEMSEPQRGYIKALAFYFLTLSLPTVIINGALWAQCDAIYASLALMGIYYALSNYPYRSSICFALSLSFKIQAIFILPILFVLWGTRRIRVKHLFAFLLTILMVCIPAIICGRSLMDCFSIYTKQIGEYNQLTLNAPSIYQLLNQAVASRWIFSNVGIIFAVGATIFLTAVFLRQEKTINNTLFIDLAFLLCLMIPYLLPHMHERYFYLADALSVAYFACHSRRVYAPVLMVFCSLNSYLAFLQEKAFIPQPMASLLLLMLLCGTTVLLAKDLRMRRSASESPASLMKGEVNA